MVVAHALAGLLISRLVSLTAQLRLGHLLRGWLTPQRVAFIYLFIFIYFGGSTSRVHWLCPGSPVTCNNLVLPGPLFAASLEMGSDCQEEQKKDCQTQSMPA